MHYVCQGSPQEKYKAWWVGAVWAEFLPHHNVTPHLVSHTKALSVPKAYKSQHVLCMLRKTLYVHVQVV